MKINLWVLRTLVAVSIGMSLGVIRKKDDPILRTQTDPISYQQKMEEEKDGKKGAPAPSFAFYKKSRFLTEPPMTAGNNLSERKVPEEKIPKVGDPIPENLEEAPQEQPSGADDGEWFEDADKGKEEKIPDQPGKG